MTATAQRFQASWNGITFNAHLDNSGLVEDPAHVDTQSMDKYVLDRLEDVLVQVSDYRELLQYKEGASPNETFENTRILRLRGRIDASAWGKLEDAKLALDAAFSPMACREAFRTNDPPNLAPFDFRIASVLAPDGVGGVARRRFYCRPATGRPIVIGQQGSGLSLPFVAEVVAFDTRQYQYTEQTQALATNGTQTAVTNAGNVYVSPKFVVVLAGAGSNPVTLTNVTTGAVWTMNLSGLAAGTYTIDVRRSRFTKADGTNVYGTRLSGFLANLNLVPGVNQLTWAGAANLTSVTARWRSAWA